MIDRPVHLALTPDEARWLLDAAELFVRIGSSELDEAGQTLLERLRILVAPFKR